MTVDFYTIRIFPKEHPLLIPTDNQYYQSIILYVYSKYIVYITLYLYYYVYILIIISKKSDNYNNENLNEKLNFNFELKKAEQRKYLSQLSQLSQNA
jgi:hypothetical protein